MTANERIYPITDYRRVFFFLSNDDDAEEAFLASAFFNSNRVVAFTSRYSRTDVGIDRNCMEVLLMVKGTIVGIGAMTAMQGFFIGPPLNQREARRLQDVIFEMNVDSEAWECNMLVDQICTAMGYPATARRIVDNAMAALRTDDYLVRRQREPVMDLNALFDAEADETGDYGDDDDDETSVASTVSSATSDDGAVCSGDDNRESHVHDDESTVEWHINVYDQDAYNAHPPPKKPDPEPHFDIHHDEDDQEREHLYGCAFYQYNQAFERYFQDIVDWYLDDIAFNNINTDEPPEKRLRESMVELACDI